MNESLMSFLKDSKNSILNVKVLPGPYNFDLGKSCMRFVHPMLDINDDGKKIYLCSQDNRMEITIDLNLSLRVKLRKHGSKIANTYHHIYEISFENFKVYISNKGNKE